MHAPRRGVPWEQACTVEGAVDEGAAYARAREQVARWLEAFRGDDSEAAILFRWSAITTILFSSRVPPRP